MKIYHNEESGIEIRERMPLYILISVLAACFAVFAIVMLGITIAEGVHKEGNIGGIIFLSVWMAGAPAIGVFAFNQCSQKIFLNDDGIRVVSPLKKKFLLWSQVADWGYTDEGDNREGDKFYQLFFSEKELKETRNKRRKKKLHSASVKLIFGENDKALVCREIIPFCEKRITTSAFMPKEGGETLIETVLSEKTKLDKALSIAEKVWLVVFVGYFIANHFAGGGAFNGKVDGNHYFVGDHGDYTEVSSTLWTVLGCWELLLFLIAIGIVALIAGLSIYAAISGRKKRRLDKKTAPKKTLRAEIRKRLQTFSHEKIIAASESITKQVIALPEFESAQTVFVYVSTPTEPQTFSIIEEAWRRGKTVCVPKCRPQNQMDAVPITSFEQLKFTAMGLAEPLDLTEVASPEDIDFAVIPCMAADKNGNRLGHGAGYYDRFLAGTKMTKACLCFEDLLCESVPTDIYDIPMDLVITESGIYKR